MAPPAFLFIVMSGSHMDGVPFSDQAKSDDTYARRTAHGSSENSRGNPNGAPSDDEEYVPGYSHGQFRRLSDFEKQHFHPLNVTPDRPCSAFFRAAEASTKDIFDSLLTDGIPAHSVRCLSRKPTGETLITFSKEEFCVQFLEKSAFYLRNRAYPTHPEGAELTFLTIYDAPHELPDSAIEERLKPFCSVFSRRRGKLQGYRDVHNGIRHYRVELFSNVPCYLRFGKFQLRFSHAGQPKTCRKCGALDHIARDCSNDVCFNCDTIGHVSKSCPERMRCCICKSEQHKAIDCPFSWHRRPTTHRDAAADDAAPDAGPDDTPPDPGPTPDPDARSAAESSSQHGGDDSASGFTATPTPSARPTPSGAPSGSPSTPSPGFHLNPDGFLLFQPAKTTLPRRPATVMPSTDRSSSRDFSLLTEFVVTDEDDDDEDDDDDFVDVEENRDADDDADDGDDDDDGLADNNEDMDTADPPAQSSSSPGLDSIAFQESIPLAAAVKKAPTHRKTIGRRNPGKLSSSLSAPSRRPTTPNPIASRKKPSANSSASSKGSENAPT